MTGPGAAGYRLGIDIGGTFTDVVMLAPDGTYWTDKVSSTPEDYSHGIVQGAKRVLEDRRLHPSCLDEIIHGTTVATNAILERKGVKTALITTRGFRDVLAMRRLRIPRLYDIFYRPPPPLVDRPLRLEVDERIGSRGEIVEPLDEGSVETAARRIQREDVRAVAVALLHSYRNPRHERTVEEVLRRLLPGVFISLSVDVLPEIREYERTSTTVVNAYLGPIVKGYLESLGRRLRRAGITAPVRVMQSNGGVMSADSAATTPVRIIESGPAAGVVAANAAGLKSGVRDILTFDMGGTTAKASLIENGRPSWTTDHEIGAGISLSSRLIKGGGYAVKVPVMDLAEVGAGGGSIVAIDRGGVLKVGPQSAGAVPGPVAYGMGGTEPTVTDANIVLGFIDPHRIAGGAVELKPQLSRRALDEKVAGPLGVGPLEAAYGVHTVANATMIRAIKAVSTYRGRDPRDFTLMAFGGSGPIHAAGMARSLGITRVMVPPAPGVFSALGLLEAQPEYHFVQTFYGSLSGLDPSSVNDAYKTVADRAQATLAREGYRKAEVTWRRSADLRYVGQGHELTVETPGDGDLDGEDLIALGGRFHREHERNYGHSDAGQPVELVNLRLAATSTDRHTRPERPTLPRNAPSEPGRQVYFGPDHGSLTTPVLTRAGLTAAVLPGPIVVEEFDATTVVPPECTARLDEWNNIVIDVGQANE